MRFRIIAAVVTVALLGAAPAHAAGRDALRRKARAQLRGFADWLDSNDARGYVGEVGWPDDRRGDARKWNRLARDWFRLARAERMWVSGWATGEWWNDYKLAMFEDRRPVWGVDTPSTQAPVIQDFADRAGRAISITVNGGEFGSPIAAKSSRFSNERPGAYNTRYHYDRQGTFDYLERRGIKHVRIPFRWERIQPRLGRALDRAELDRIKEVVARAAGAGMRSILDVHNYGLYYLERQGRGVRTPIGTRGCTIADFADLWRRLAKAFKGDDRVLMYALMAEPTRMREVNGVRPARIWEKASQRAVKAIRRTGDDHLIAVPGYGWDALQVFARHHEDGWIDDPAGRFFYEVHHYWDGDHSGDYGRSYAAEVEAAEDDGW